MFPGGGVVALVLGGQKKPETRSECLLGVWSVFSPCGGVRLFVPSGSGIASLASAPPCFYLIFHVESVMISAGMRLAPLC